MIAEKVMIVTASTIRDTKHNFSDLSVPMKRQSFSAAPVVIEDDLWISHGMSVLSEVTIGTGAVVAAGAVVTKDVPPFAVAGGMPAQILTYRNDQSI